MINKELKKRILSSTILIPVSFFFIFEGSITFIFFLSIIFLAMGFEWFKMTKKKELIRILGLFFLFFSFYSAIYLRQYIGLNFFLFLIIVCIFTDIGGYLFGKIFKGPKLTKISPKKTISGAIGSFVLCSIFLTSSFYFLTKKFDLTILLIAIIISSSCQLGDLFFSYLKRKAKVKDTGNFLPGHGGVLDRLDGIFLGVPIGLILIFLLLS